ncbi:MAG: branched-chain amino acid transaminase [Planctomycetes bacterium]|jgi:branched-chain amino acid aminotransferase|nr:branched-chain amino acid transaminase [Planctomycetota bacterium]
MKRTSDKIWKDGQFIDFDDAKIHILSHVIHYGSCVFEGIRCYDVNGKSCIFRLPEHAQRLLDSGKIYRMEVKWTRDDLMKAMKETVKANKFKACYIRPLIFRGTGGLGVNPFKCAIETWVITWEWGAYLGPEALEKGVDVQVSTWTRMAPNTMPAMAKAACNYMNAQLTKMEAVLNNMEEGIALDVDGFVSEGSGENLFAVRNGILFTPPLSASILSGITRDSILNLARDKGIPIREERLPREMLYLADELFFTGTAAEVTPIRTVDRIKIGAGVRGPMTTELQKSFLDIVTGKGKDKFGWLSPIDA